MTQGQILLDIPPAPGNPRNSEGAFLALRDGSLLFAYSRFRGESDADHAGADIVGIRSRDGGESWSAPETLLSAQALGAMNVMSLSLLRLENGDLGLIYLNRKSWQDMRPELRRSADEGVAWSAPVCCAARPGYFVINNDRAVRLSSGRILLPAAEHTMTVEQGELRRFGSAIGRAFYSDDDGRTWQEGELPFALPGERSWGGMQEPGVIELPGRLIYCWGRTVLGRQYECFSRNGGQGFSAPAPSCFTSPLSPLSMKRLSDGRLLAVWNPVPEYQTRVSYPRTGGRTPLVYAVSEAAGGSWGDPVSLEDDPHAGFGDTAIYETNGFIYLGYCAGNTDTDGACLNKTRLRRLRLTEL